MKNLFNKILIIAIVAFCGVAKAQSDDAGRISLTAFIAENENLPQGATAVLSNKLNQITNVNGMGSTGFNRFIITANLITSTKDIIASAPPMTALTLDVTLYIGDGIEGRKFSSHSMTVKGVGINENKAYMDAIKNIKPNDAKVQSFITEGKNKIIEYYNTRCNFIMKEAQNLEAQNRLEEAIMILTSVPDASLDCYNKSMAAVAPLYKKLIDRNCKLRLVEATNVWNTTQTLEGANAAGEILSSIDPQSSCFSQVQALSEKIGRRVLELDKREWNYKFESEIGLQKDLIKAYRDVGVAYGNGQPQSMTYNIIGWW